MAYIDKERIQSHLRLKCLAKYPDTFINGLLAAANEIGEMPTADVVEVVRCADCKYCKAIKDSLGNPSLYCDLTYAKPDIDATDYCSQGERRTDNE